MSETMVFVLFVQAALYIFLGFTYGDEPRVALGMSAGLFVLPGLLSAASGSGWLPSIYELGWFIAIYIGGLGLGIGLNRVKP